MLTIFTSITLEGWVDVMYNLFDGWGVNWIVVFYFIMLVLIGSFFMLNLFLAVVFDEYVEATEEMAREDELALQSLLDAGISPKDIKEVLLKEQADAEPGQFFRLDLSFVFSQ